MRKAGNSPQVTPCSAIAVGSNQQASTQDVKQDMEKASKAFLYQREVEVDMCCLIVSNMSNTGCSSS